MKKLIVCILILCSCSLASLHIAYNPSDCTLFANDDEITILCKIFEEKEHIGSYSFFMDKSVQHCKELIITNDDGVDCYYSFDNRECKTGDENGVLIEHTYVRTNTRKACLRAYQDLKRISKKYE